jgi:dynein heavy chain
LTTTDVFPISLLHRGIKITLQPPRGLRNNLLRIYQSQDAKTFDESPFEYKKLLFGLSYFHSVVIGRCQYGQLGWSVPYEFSGVDLAVS